MGGRGTKSYYTPQIDRSQLPYTVVSWQDYVGRAVVPFVSQTGRAWHIVRHASNEPNHNLDSAFTFGQDTPTLRWVNGEQVVDLYIAGMDTAAFLTHSGLELDMSKGGFVLSKRVSRVLRPQRMSGLFDAGNVQIAYMQQTEDEAKVWDGAALVSRSMLEGMAMAGDLPASKRESLAKELSHMQRVEFTILTANGQDKGHAMVVDDLRDAEGKPIDFLLPEDTKAQVKLTTGQTFVGLSPVHGHNDMRLDVQSLINLTPFFDPDELLGYVKDEGELFLQGIENGEVEEIIGRIRGLNENGEISAETADQWPLRALVAAGGDPTQYRSHIKTLVNQHLERLNYQTLEKMRLPVPGGRHYVMPAGIAKRGGIEIDNVGRGEVFIDDKRGTAWVNDADWLAMQDGNREGIAGILGGADNDDGLWLYGFTDYDGQQKVLTWRSPNQVGEYVVLRPTENSGELTWTTANGETVSYLAADSRKLPQRIDGQSVDYSNAVDPDTAGGIGEDSERYSTDAMNAAIERSVANEGVLGMYCNALMLHQALHGTLPDTLPAPLEDVIDSSVKTGADVSKVRDWCFDHSREILESGTPIPDVLHKRVSVDRTLPREEQPPSPRRMGSEYHWLAQLQQGIQQHIDDVSTRRDVLIAAARPPQALFDSVAQDQDGLQLGREMNRRFGAALNKRDSFNQFSEARRSVEDFLSYFDPATQRRILRGALASVYMGEGETTSDAAVWLARERAEELVTGREFLAVRQLQAVAREGQWSAVGVRMVEALWEVV